MADFSMTVSVAQGVATVTMSGMITESVDLDANKIAPGQPVVIDTARVNHMNSLGVRNWILFMEAVCQRAQSVSLDNLSPMMVFQASMISTFLGGAKVRTFQSPWVCEECDHMTVLTHGLQEAIPETIACPKCKSAMEFDSDLDSYQSFRFQASQNS